MMDDTKIGSDRAPRGVNSGASVTEFEPKEALAFLRERLSESGSEPGRLILVSGSVASGKTRLLGDFLDLAAHEGVRALSATGAEDERTLACGIVDQLLTSPDLPRAAAEQAGRLIETFHGAATGTDEYEATRAGARLVWRLAQVFLDLARDRPMVIVVDDVHLADSTSVLLLRYLQRRLRSTRLTIVLSVGDRLGPAGRPTYFTRHTHHHIRLTLMSEEAVRDLLGELLGDCVGGTLASLIHELSAGVPMLVNPLIEDFFTSGDVTEPASATSAYAEALVSYLDRWDLPLREVAGRAAVLGGPVSCHDVAGLAGIAADVAEEAVEALTDLGLLSDGRFRHSVTESAALGGLSPESRASAHLRAAELRFQQAAPPKEVAAHLVAGGSAAARWATAVLVKAGEQAVADDEPEFARQCLELALAASTTDAGRRSILGTLARHTWRVSPSAARRYLDALPEPDGSTPAGGDEAAAMARKALWQGDAAAYRSRWEAAAGQGDAQAEAELRLAYEWWFGPAGAASPASPERPRGDDPWRLTATELSGIWRQAGNDASTAAAERILRSCRPADDSLEALMTAVLALVYAGRTTAAETWWRSLMAEADRRGAVTWQALLSGMWSGVVLRGGDVPYAVELARHALDLLPAQDWGVAIGEPLTTLLLAHTATGDHDRAAEVLEHHVPDGMFRTVAGVRYVRARGRYHLAAGRLLAAVSDFQECRQLLAALGGDLPVIAPWRADLAAANLALGNADVARDLAAEQLELAAETDAYTRGLSLRTLAYAGEPANRQETLGQAAEKLAESGDQWEARRMSRMLELSRRRRIAAEPGDRTARRASGGGPRAASSVALSERVVVSRDAVPAAVVSSGLSATAQIDQGSGGAEAISGAEWRVAELAALGLTNQEISSSLFITVSTVEQHLTRVYRKLGIRSRAFLPAKLGAV